MHGGKHFGGSVREANSMKKLIGCLIFLFMMVFRSLADNPPVSPPCNTAPSYGPWSCSATLASSAALDTNKITVWAGQSIVPPGAHSLAIANVQETRLVSFNACAGTQNYQEVNPSPPGFGLGNVSFAPMMPPSFPTPGTYVFTASVEVIALDGSCSCEAPIGNLTVTVLDLNGSNEIGNLLNVSFGADPAAKVGFAVVGQTTNDYWNGYSQEDAYVSWDQAYDLPWKGPLFAPMQWADGTNSGASLACPIALPWEGHFTFPDAMFDQFMYNASDFSGASYPIVLTGLPSGTYDFYLYGHGSYDEWNTVFQLSTSDGTDYGANATAASGTDWQSPIWREGQQYVVFRGVSLTSNLVTTITVGANPGPNADPYAFINGMQIARIAPRISQQPAGQIVWPGQTASFSVAVAGTNYWTYQWQLNGVAIPGATNATLMLTNVQLAQAGIYTVVVGGVVTSAPASLEVVSVMSPLDISFDGPRTGTAVVGIGPQDYWNVCNPIQGPSSYSGLLWADGIPSGAQMNVPGSSAPTVIVLTNLPAGDYDIYVYMPLNSQEWAYFSVDNGDWGFFGSSLAVGDLTNSDYAVATGVNVENGYPVTITAREYSGYEATTFIPADITAIQVQPDVPLPSITTQPGDQRALEGQSASFAVVAAGRPPLTYQWLFDETNIAGATNSTLTLTNIQLTQAGNYSVQVSNIFGVSISSQASLVVFPGCDPAPSGLVSWWKGEGNCLDSFGANPGTAQGQLLFGSGEVRQAFNFVMNVPLSGITSSVRISASPSLNVGTNSGLSLECWLRPYIVGVWGGSYVNAFLGWDDGVRLATAEGGNWQLGFVASFTDTSGNDHNLWGPASIFGIEHDNTEDTYEGPFIHVVATYDQASGLAALYYNGALAASQNLGTFVPETGSDLQLGGLPGSDYDGVMDEVSIYNRALSANEVNLLYLAGSGGKCAAPPAIVSPPASGAVCYAASTTFTVSAGGTSPLSYQWLKNGIQISGANQASYTIESAASNDAGTYSVIVANSVGAVTSAGATLAITTPPTATLSGSQSICNGDSATLGANLTGTAPWNVTWSDGSNQTVTASPATRLANPSVTTTYTVTALSDAACAAVPSGLNGSNLVIVFPRPTAVVAGTTNICAGSTTLIQAALTGTGPWNITWSDGTNENVTTNAPQHPVSPVVNTAYTVTDLIDTHCTALPPDLTGAAVVRLNPHPTAVVSGTQAICNGEAATIHATLSGTAPWAVYWSDGHNQPNVYANPVSYYPTPTASTIYTVTNLIDANCQSEAGGLTGSAVVTVEPPPTAVVSGSTTLCAGGATTIQAALTGSQPWSVTWSDGFQQQTNSSPAIRTVAPAITTTYTVASLTDSRCTTAATGLSGSAVVTVNPRPTAVVSGPDGVDADGTATIQATLTGTAPWTVKWSDSVAPSNVTASPALHTVSPATQTTYTVTALSDANCAALTSDLSGSAQPIIIPATWLANHFGSGYLGNPSAAPNADPDGDGLSNLREYLMGTDPNNFTPTNLGYWPFDTTNWTGAQGQLPMVATTNLALLPDWSTNAVRVDSTNAANLKYNQPEIDGSANINLTNGSVSFWFRPDWSSGAVAGGTGPGDAGRLLELGFQGTTGGAWSILVSADGSRISFVTQSNGQTQTNASAPITWQTNEWHQVFLTCSNSTSLYLDGLPAVTAGPPVALSPNATVCAQTGFNIGSDASGNNQARGSFDELKTYTYVLSASAIWNDWATKDIDGDGIPNGEDAAPNNPGIGLPSLEIDYPANGATAY
jgi:hypothetical protein